MAGGHDRHDHASSRLEYVSGRYLLKFHGNPRRIRRFRTNPILVDGTGTILAGSSV
jgi:hypothetical protein